MAQTVVHTPTKDHYLTLSIILVFVCFFCLKCEALFCVVPAILFAIGVSMIFKEYRINYKLYVCI